MKNIVIFKEPALKPLPPSISKEDIRNALLPVKVTAMRKAIMACGDIPELLEYKRTADGLAAAARTIQHEIPEQCAAMNRTAKSAVLRLGQLLIRHSNSCAAGKGVKGAISPRTAKARECGIDFHLAHNATRLASAPKEAQKRALQDKANSAHTYVRRNTPPVINRRDARSPGTLEFFRILTNTKSGIRRLDLGVLQFLSEQECAIVRKSIVEMQELFDALDQSLPHAAKREFDHKS